MALQHLRSSTAHKRPVPGNMSDGQIGINTNLASPGLFFKDTNGDLVKVGPVHVGTTAPNASPASGGTAGNSVGEQWLDTTGGTYVFKVWDGSAWRSETGTFVDVNGDVMTGALGIIAGSNGSPGIYFSGDTNTGIYSPGADQVAISTGGSGKLFVNNAGEVDVSSANARLYITTTGANTAVATLRNASYYYNINLDGANGGLTFYNGTERLRITAAGLVGIGTSAPNSAFEVGTSGVNLDGSMSALPGAAADAAVIIGKTNALGSAPFDQAGSIIYRPRVSSVAGRSSHIFYTGSPSAIRMVINETGNVGIGTTSPGYALDVNGAGSFSGSLRATSTGTFTVLPAGVSGSWTGSGFAIQSEAGTAPIGFLQGASERARIDSSGRLLVGTSTARANFLNTTGTARLQVEGTDANNSVVSITRNSANTGGAFLYLNKTRGAAVGDNTIVQSGDTLGGVVFEGSDGSEFVAGAWILGEVDGTPGANDMPGRLVFSTTADLASSPTEQLRITSDRYVRLASGTGGIQFGGDTAAANALDDYEEGTFTPTIVGTSTAGTATYAANGQVGRYTKIGNRVFFDLYLSWTAHTGTGDLQINGLPFTVQNTTNLNRNYSAILNVVAMTAGNLGAAFSSPNTTAVALRQMPTGGGSVATIPMDTSAQISISGCFEA
jgi:hypothetical protein